MEVIVHAIVASVFVCLGLSLFFGLLPGSYVAPPDVLQVLLLLGGCMTS